MLRKLLKHEWNATKKLLLPLNLSLIVITLIGCIILNTNIFNQESFFPLAIFLLIFYILSLVTLGMVSSIYLFVRFYKNLFTAEGYLMFTLPVSSLQLFHSKLLVGFFWSIINCLFTILSIFALGFSAAFHSFFEKGASDITQFFQTGIVLGKGSEVISFQSLFGFTPMQFLLLFIGMSFIGCFFSLNMGYVSVALGQLIQQYKLACSIAFYIAFGIVTQIVSSILMILFNFNMLQSDTTNFTFTLGEIYQKLFPASYGISFFLGLLFYTITVVIIRRKVNLD
ncbi:MAG: hypothetical protein RR139_02210 [Lachnospiraceae bacterium]